MNEWSEADKVLFTDDNVRKALMKMKLNEACGANCIYAEHLRYARPEIVVIFK